MGIRESAIMPAVAAALALQPAVARAADAVVVSADGDCDDYVAESTYGYVLVAWQDGSRPREGDVLAGDYSRDGMKKLRDISAGSRTRASLRDYFPTRDAALETLREHWR